MYLVDKDILKYNTNINDRLAKIWEKLNKRPPPSSKKCPLLSNKRPLPPYPKFEISAQGAYLECWVTANNISSTVGKILDRKLPEIRESLLPAVKSEIQIRENLFPRNAKSRQSTKLNSRENFMPLLFLANKLTSWRWGIHRSSRYACLFASFPTIFYTVSGRLYHFHKRQASVADTFSASRGCALTGTSTEV